MLHMAKLEQKDYVRLLEALLFATAEPLTAKDLHARLPEDADLSAILNELESLYEGRGIELKRIGNGFAFRTAEDMADFLVLEREEERKLSRAALEMLSIVAYHQPITRAEIENIRGVATSKGTLDILLEQGWIKPGPRRESPGRPVTWMTSSHFLDHFQLESLTDLPGLDELKASGLLDRRPAIETVPSTAELFENDDNSDTYNETLAEEEV